MSTRPGRTVRSSTSPTSAGEGTDDAAPGTALQTKARQPGLGTVVSGGGLPDGKGALHVGMVFAVKWVRCPVWWV